MSASRSTSATDPARRNVEEIASLERQSEQQQSLGERISTAVTNTIGTGWCAGLHAAGFVAWIAWNVRLAPGPWRFDPYPFGLLTMWVSMEGVVLAILVLITQNRMSRQSDRRDHLDLQVDLLAEQEMTMVLRLLSRIAEQLGVTATRDDAVQTERLMQHTNVRELMDELGRRFP